ncbi:COG3650 family protein [Novosphingobium album (ex Hu et al. 2023)]|uniref:Lipoprotein n=1 Tax=Novosphingobium album (ex Hu et al. 2023) TaxID=2930093 RepID=A0ABT0B4B3_9SPHN|nr:hypothetical protein [Novosphingobium album (ex Hu et al. 2023)]MCJ2179746.1 hypothetical protein [Novosphingobium album (ex Hu et al. 2023)]
MTRRLCPFTLMLTMSLSACGGGGGVPGDSEDRAPFHALATDEAVKVTGTEPFWGGEISGGHFTYTTPENPGGFDVPVSRFAGRGGLSFSGEAEGKALTLAITPGECSDGMSDRKYPFVVTLRLGDELRQGCGWTARQAPVGGE